MSSLAQRQNEKDKAAQAATRNGLSREWFLGPEIDFYLRSLAKRLKKPLEIRHMRVHPARISDELVPRLKDYEQDMLGPREELAALEFAETKHGQQSAFDIGRRKLTNLVAIMAMPLADVTQAYDLDLSLSIGKRLVEPLAADGLGMYATVESQNTPQSGVHAVLKRRFANKRDDPSKTGPDIEVGMTLVCRPGKIDPDAANDDGTSQKFIRLVQNDPNSLLAHTANMQQAIDQSTKEHGDKHSAADRDAAAQASAALNTFLLILWDEERLVGIDNAQHGVIGTVSTADVNLPPGALLFVDELDRALEGLKNIPSSLGVAIEHFREMLATTFPADGTHNQGMQQPSDKQQIFGVNLDKDDDSKLTDINQNGIDDTKKRSMGVVVLPVAQQAAVAAQELVVKQQQHAAQEQLNEQPAEPKTPAARGILPSLLGDPQPQDS